MAAYWNDYEDEFDDECRGESDDCEDDFSVRAHRSSYEPEPSRAEIKSIILEVMGEENVTPSQVPNEGGFSMDKADYSKRYFETKGFAWFCCPRKHNRWPSAHSWCYMDLKKQEICYRDQQKCRKDSCETEVQPGFTEESVEKMARYAVKQFLIRTGRRPRGRRVPRGDDGDMKTDGGPHDQSRCGKCQRLGRSCWQ